MRVVLLTASCLAVIALFGGCAGCAPPPPSHLNAPDPNDIDGDGVPNNLDEDIDGDGIPNIADPDVDGDGIKNADEVAAGTNPFGDGSSQLGAQGDLDGDGVPNYLDNDDNGDGIPDGVVGAGTCDGGLTTVADENHDCDGYCISVEAGYIACNDGAVPGSGVPDSDGDGIPDPLDPDDDGDGVPDAVDPNNNGQDPVDPGGGGEPAGCTTSTFTTGSDILDPRILLVVDKSGSMGQAATGFGSDKWTTARSALESVALSLNGSVELGLMLYPDNGNGDDCRRGSVNVDVAPNNASPIVNRLDATDPGGGTPTAATLARAKEVLDALPAAGGPRAVVVATDGGPNCNASLNGSTCTCVDPTNQGNCGSTNCLDDSNAIASAAALDGSGYPVFVIGVPGSENFSNVLNAMANAGGTAQAGATAFYSAASSADLATALDDIAVRVGACRFDLPHTVNPSQVTVTVDGTDVPRDTTRLNGWDLTDPDTVELFGGPCAATVNGGASAAVVTIQVCNG